MIAVSVTTRKGHLVDYRIFRDADRARDHYTTCLVKYLDCEVEISNDEEYEDETD